MTYIDYNSANVSEREIFSCTQDRIEPVYDSIKKIKGVEGSVLIATCNRTELYLSLDEEAEADPCAVLCEAMDLDTESYRHLFRFLENDDAMRHASRLAAGTESQIIGDTQIITQVREALWTAHKNKATDPVLNVMFRNAISAGKKVRTSVDLSARSDSTIDQAVKRILEDPEIRTVLIVGNGVIGRGCADLLARAGIDTRMTLRHYHHGESIIPHGVEPVAYDKRYEVMESCDAVICATSSPHCVLKYEEVKALNKKPSLIIDMAVPRDCEPEIDSIEGIALEDIDDISMGADRELREEQTKAADRYINKYLDDFHHWCDYREYGNLGKRYFPVFIDSEGREVLVIGGGNIAERRILSLLNFRFEITVLSPEVTDTLKEHADNGDITWFKGKYEKMDMMGYDMVIAATNDSDVNHMIAEHASKSGVMYNICDDRNISDMWFPALAMNDELTVGVIGSGNDHSLVKRAASRIRKLVEGKKYR